MPGQFPLSPGGNGPGTYQDNNPALSYSGAWQRRNVAGASGGTVTGNVYGYTNAGGYTIAVSIAPGRAYWVKSTGASVVRRIAVSPAASAPT